VLAWKDEQKIRKPPIVCFPKKKMMPKQDRLSWNKNT